MLRSTRTIPTALRGVRSMATAAEGIKISTRDDGSRLSELSVVIRAGSRFSPAPGVSHTLEKFAFRVSTFVQSTFNEIINVNDFI